jgi:hypothetical protein
MGPVQGVLGWGDGDLRSGAFMVILLPHPSRRASSGQAVAPVGRHLPPAPEGVPLRFRGRLKEGPARSSVGWWVVTLET